MCCVELQPTYTSWPISLVIVLYVVLAGHLWRFNLDKNQSTTITPNFEFVIEFLQSIFFYYQVIAIEFLQSSFCNRFFLQFAIKFLKSSFCNRVCELSFCKLSHVFFCNWVFVNWVFAIKFVQLSLCNQVFANWVKVFAIKFVQIEFLQSSYSLQSTFSYNPVFAVDLASSSSTIALPL